MHKLLRPPFNPYDKDREESLTPPYEHFLKGHPEEYYDPKFLVDMQDLFSGRRAGHAFTHVMAGEAFQIWEQFTRAADTTYYPFNEEAELIESNPDWFRITAGLSVGEGSIVVELGTGSEYSAERKTMPFINALNGSVYVGVDQSLESAYSVTQYVKEHRPGTAVFMRLTDFNKDKLHIEWDELISPIARHASEELNFELQTLPEEEPKRRILAQFGSTIGNKEAFIGDAPPFDQVVSDLVNYRTHMRPDDVLFLGLDQNQDSASLDKGYSSPLIRDFSLAMLRRIENELPVRGKYDPDDFDYVRMWNKRNGLYFHGYNFKKNGHFWLKDEKISMSANHKVSHVGSWKFTQRFLEDAIAASGMRQIDRLDGPGNRMHIHALKIA